MDVASPVQPAGVNLSKISFPEYQRPDLKLVLDQLRRSRLRLRLAMSIESAMRAVEEFLNCWAEYQQARDIAILRHEQNTADLYFLAEAEFFATADGQVLISLANAFQALGSCRFREDLIARLNPDVLVVASRLNDQVSDRLKDDFITENQLNLKLHDWIAQSRIFCLGQRWSLYALPALLESPQRSIRKAALRGLDDFLKTHAEWLDQQLDRLLELRLQIARKQRQQNIHNRSCRQVGLGGLAEENRHQFRNLVIQYFVPMTMEIRRLQRKRFGFEQLQDYDALCLLPQGHPVPTFSRESMLSSIGALLKPMIETGISKVEPVDIPAFFSPAVADFMLRPDMRGDDLAVYLQNSGITYWRLIQHGTMADIAHQLCSAGILLGSVDWSVPDPACPTVHHPRLKDIARSSWQGYLTELATFSRLETIVSDPELYSLLRMTQIVESIVWKTMIDEFSEQIFEQNHILPENRRDLWLKLEKKYCPDICHDNMPFLAEGGLMYLAMDEWIQPYSALAGTFGLMSALSVWSRHRKAQNRLVSIWQKLLLQDNRKSYFQLISELEQPSPWDETMFKQLAYTISSELVL